MPPRLALSLTAAAVFTGPFLFGMAVARTIGEDLASPRSLTLVVVLIALVCAISWSLLTWFFGIPSSPSHALVGGIIGSVAVSVGWGDLKSAGIIKVLLALFFSPILGFVIGFIVNRLVLFLARGATLRINWFFKNGQILTGVALALSHGANDAQKSIGMMVLGLVTQGFLTHFEIPLWVILVNAAAISLGTALGGWRLIRTLGSKFYRVRPVDSFCSQIGSAGVILGAALLGGPVSTTQVVSSSILGVGASERINKVRWGLAGQIVMAWVLTIPSNMALAAGLYSLTKLFH